MDIEELRAKAQRLREFARALDDEYAYVEVSIENDDYYVDLGQFGEQTMTVYVEDDRYEIDPAMIVERIGYSSGEFAEMADDIEAAIDETPEPTLDGVLSVMESGAEDEKILAQALRAVVRVFERGNGIPTNALPPSPLPWPGALREEIDYTADDFPLRYQPPPGFDWASMTPRSTRVPYQNAVRREAVDLAGTMEMVIDDKGRVRWQDDADGDYSSGRRWVVWHMDRDAIPQAFSFTSDTPPRAIDIDGRIIPEDHTKGTEYAEPGYNWWDDEDDFEQAFEILSNLPPAPATGGGNGQPVTFEPPAPVA